MINGNIIITVVITYENKINDSDLPRRSFLTFFRKSVVSAVVVPYQSTGHGSLATIRPPLIFTLSPHHDRLRLARGGAKRASVPAELEGDKPFTKTCLLSLESSLRWSKAGDLCSSWWHGIEAPPLGAVGPTTWRCARPGMKNMTPSEKLSAVICCRLARCSMWSI